MKPQTAVCALFLVSLAAPSFAEAEPAQVDFAKAFFRFFDFLLALKATDLTVINVTDKQVVVREAVVSELALPTGTTKGYLEAFRSKVDANSKISEYLSSERWKGFKPPPLPER